MGNTSDFIIITDSCCDLSFTYLRENNIVTLGVNYYINGAEFQDDNGESVNVKEFYNEIRSGKMPTTSQINFKRYAEVFKKYVQSGKAIIYIGFSSALSGCINSAFLGKQEVEEEIPEADITIIDSKSASIGEGLAVFYASEMKKSGHSKEEIVKWLEDYKLKINHYFTVEDLANLRRGGRIGSATALIGTVLDIKPILNVDDEGNLVCVNKVKGRKKSLQVLHKEVKERIVNPETQELIICNADSYDDAEYLKNSILKDVNVKNIIMVDMGPVIGTHTGPGAVGVVFLGEKR